MGGGLELQREGRADRKRAGAQSWGGEQEGLQALDRGDKQSWGVCDHVMKRNARGEDGPAGGGLVQV